MTPELQTKHVVLRFLQTGAYILCLNWEVPKILGFSWLSSHHQETKSILKSQYGNHDESTPNMLLQDCTCDYCIFKTIERELRTHWFTGTVNRKPQLNILFKAKLIFLTCVEKGYAEVWTGLGFSETICNVRFFSLYFFLQKNARHKASDGI